jgi:hypothetical protein
MVLYSAWCVAGKYALDRNNAPGLIGEYMVVAKQCSARTLDRYNVVWLTCMTKRYTLS